MRVTPSSGLKIEEKLMHRSNIPVTEKNTIVSWRVWCIALICLLSAGCGITQDIGTGMRSVQFGPERLCSPEFYSKATPEEVAKEINGVSLAGVYYTRKFVSRNPGFFSLDPFFSSSSVETEDMYPLTVAAANTPHPEVMRMLLDAGADVPPFNAPVFTFLSKHPSLKALRLLRPYMPWDESCTMLNALITSAGSVSLLEEYSTNAPPDVDFNCRSSGQTLLETAIEANRDDIVVWLADKGASLAMPTSNGLSPLELAEQYRFTECAATLRRLLSAKAQ